VVLLLPVRCTTASLVASKASYTLIHAAIPSVPASGGLAQNAPTGRKRQGTLSTSTPPHTAIPSTHSSPSTATQRQSLRMALLKKPARTIAQTLRANFSCLDLSLTVEPRPWSSYSWLGFPAAPECEHRTGNACHWAMASFSYVLLVQSLLGHGQLLVHASGLYYWAMTSFLYMLLGCTTGP